MAVDIVILWFIRKYTISAAEKTDKKAPYSFEE